MGTLASNIRTCKRKLTFPGGAVVAQLTVNQRVAGSNPARGASQSKPGLGLAFLIARLCFRGLLEV